MKLLDLFCGSGGAAVGYERAGIHEIVGVDWEGQRGWPLRFEFIMEDAIEWLRRNVKFVKEEFDAIHASPPCQRWSIVTPERVRHPDLITPIRELILETELPYVIENVPGAPLVDPIMLCGTMFNLGVTKDGTWYQLRRHRGFETNWNVRMPKMRCQHSKNTITVAGSTGRGFTVEDRKEAMGISWMINEDLVESVPPMYTEFLGRQLVKVVGK